MSDEDQHDDSFLDSLQQRMHFYRSPLLVSSTRRRRGRSGGLVALVLVIWGLYQLIAEYWQPLLLTLLALAGIVLVALILIGYAPAKPQPAPNPSQEAATAIRNTIHNTPKLGRYAWSGHDQELIRQWNHFKETGQTPIRHKTLTRRARQAERKSLPAQPPPLSARAQRILAAIKASPRLEQRAWHEHESGLLDQWQRYQTLGLLPMRRSKLEKRLAKVPKPMQGVAKP